MMKGKRKKWIYFGIIIIVGWVILKAVGVIPREGNRVFYHAPCWGKNNKIYFIKEINYALQFSPRVLPTGGWLPLKTEVYLCSMNYDGTDKKEIVKIGDTEDDTYWLPLCLDYCEANDLLLLSGGTLLGRGLNTHGIYTIKLDGSDKRKVSDGGSDASWSPDGKEIVHSGGYIINADGSNERGLFPEGSEFWGKCHSFLWSPKGDWIAFVCWGDLWIIRPDGSESRKLKGADYIDDWTRDGEGIITNAGGVINLKGERKQFAPYGGKLSLDGKFLLADTEFIVRELETWRKIDPLANRQRIKTKGHFVYKRPNNIW